ncbi:hypothetical protein BDZ89DRAFT_80159 [Hymenopellis radicata]|nr:hypothetical protein BDZ89DRAFT_80159 [Hymenopellis radicata]
MTPFGSRLWFYLGAHGLTPTLTRAHGLFGRVDDARCCYRVSNILLEVSRLAERGC